MAENIKYRQEYKDGNNYKPLFPQVYPQNVLLGSNNHSINLINCWKANSIKNVRIPAFDIGIQTITIRKVKENPFILRIYPKINNEEGQTAWDTIDQIQYSYNGVGIPTLYLTIVRLYKASTMPILVDLCYFSSINQKGAPLYG